MPSRRIFNAGLAAGTTALLNSCGTILYPDRAYQKDRSNLDPAIVILDGIGLFFFIIPGLIAFAVDFTTGAIYFPEDHDPGDRERTIFDRHDAGAKPGKQEIERILVLKTGKAIDLENSNLRTMPLDSLDQFWVAYAKCSEGTMLAATF